MSEELKVDHFRSLGATCVRGMFTDWIETLRAGIAHNQAEPGPDARIYQADGGGTFFGDYCNWQRIPEFTDFIKNSPVANLAKTLMGSDTVQLFHEHVLVKEPSADMPTPWHQDAPYYCVRAKQTISFWIPLDYVPRERTLEFVAGSHLWKQQFRPDRFSGEALNTGDTQTPVPDINGNRGDYEILGWELSPGDAVAFDFRTLHGAPGNHSEAEARRAFSLRLLGDDARFSRHSGVSTSPPFRDVMLGNDEVLVGSDFPVLIPA